MDAAPNGNGKRHVRFDPTINLGHVITAGSMLLAIIVAWRDLDARVAQTAKDLVRADAAIVRMESVSKESTGKIELDLGRRLVEQRQYINDTQVSTNDNVREIKQLIRDINSKLDTKADKPGR